MTTLTPKNAEATFLALQQSSKELAERCSKLTITDDISLQLVTQQYSLLKATIKQIEDIRVKEKAPYLDAGKQIDALAKKLSEPLSTELSSGEKKILAYNRLKAEIAQKEQNRINAIKSAISKYSADAIAEINKCTTIEQLTETRQGWVVNWIPSMETFGEFVENAKEVKIVLNDLCKAKRIELQTPAQADETISETITEAIVEQVAEVGSQEIAQAEFTTTSRLKGTWRFEVVDLSLVPRDLLMIDEKKVKELLKQRKEANSLSDGLVSDGIKFFLEESVTIR